MSSVMYSLLFTGFFFTTLQTSSSRQLYEWNVERSSVNPLSYTDETHYSRDRTTDRPASSKNLICPENERFSKYDGNCQVTCDNPNKAKLCSNNRTYGCVCKLGFVRGPGGKCINQTECPAKADAEAQHLYVTLNPPPYTDDDYHIPSSATKYPPNSETEIPQFEETEITSTSQTTTSPKCPDERPRWTSCGAHCQRNCNNKDDKEETCRPVCIPGCVCEEGLVEGPNGECIEKEKCPGNSETEGNLHVTLNPPPYTDDDYPIPLAATVLPSYSETENPELEETETPPILEAGLPSRCEGEGKRWSFCGGRNCERTCKNKDKNIDCHSVFPVLCCICDEGLVMANDGKCIKKEKCPKNSDVEESSENIDLFIRPFTGCPNATECNLACRHYGYRSGHCGGPYQFICYCHIRNHENPEHEFQSKGDPCPDKKACDTLCKYINHKKGGNCVGPCNKLCNCYK